MVRAPKRRRSHEVALRRRDAARFRFAVERIGRGTRVSVQADQGHRSHRHRRPARHRGARGGTEDVGGHGPAGGTIGAQAAAKSLPDGYTVLVGSVTSLALGPALFPKAGIDPVKLFAPVSLFTIAPSVIVINANIEAKTLQQFIELAKAKPGFYNFGAPTTASPPYISGAQFASAAGVKMVGVPFGNPAAVVTAMMNGQAHLFIETTGSLGAHIRAGKLRPLAVAHAKRHPMLPEVPTTAEAGLPDFESGTWSGLLAPAGTAAPIIQRLNAEVHKAVAAEEVRKLFVQQGGEPYPSTPEEFSRLIVEQAPKWVRAIQIAGIKPE
jgi:tripartite-type tricarboxylate transporter receptor subunit TctC